MLQCSAIAGTNRAREHIRNLSDVEFQGFSQWGEDGIIDWLVERLPGIPETFVEFGVEDYREANTRLLLQLRNWRGLVMDGSEANIRNVQAQDLHWRHDLTAQCAFIDRDNINQVIASSGLQGDIGLLSIDIDGNDYWIWQAIDAVSPVVVVCEYNAVLGDRCALTVPYRADFQRTREHHSNLYFGASIRALVALGQSKGYSFVGTTSTGCNAFFVRNDHAESITAALEAVFAFPSKFREARDAAGGLLFTSGKQRRALIDHLALMDPVSGVSLDLASWGEIYSPEWIEGRKVEFESTCRPGAK
ncbi:MAG: hypothetical protein Q8O23_00800 [Gallionella sp.]|nr:hypothetical protein [Gallionella sp.]